MAAGLVVLGCGWIAQRHATAARRLRLPLVFASRDAARARDFARRYRAVAAHGGYAEAVRDDHADAVIVCTPHDRHLADVRLALDAGKHVLVEKPIARTLEEADEMIAAAVAAGRVRSEEHTSELQSLTNLVCRLLLEKTNNCRSALTAVPPASCSPWPRCSTSYS